MIDRLPKEPTFPRPLVFSSLVPPEPSDIATATADRIANLRPTAVNAITAQMQALQAEGKDVVSLMRGEPDLPTPVHIVAAATEALARGRTGYPDNRGEPNLREAVAQKLDRENGLRFDAGSEILVTTGATMGIYAALAALLNDGDEVLLPDPVYDAYVSPIRLCGGVIRSVPAPIVNSRFVLTAEALEAAWTPRTKALILNTPWNPVGTVLTEAELIAIGEFCLRRNVFLLSDEIYETITYGDARHISPAAAVPALARQSVLINSLSKTYAMTGWRVGYCAGPEWLIRGMYLVLAQSSRGPSTFVQDAAAMALTGPQECVAEMRGIYTKRLGKVEEALAGAAKVKVLHPEAGFFAMTDVRETGIPSNDIREKLLVEHGVCVAHGAAYGPGGEGTLRVSFASGGAKLEEGLRRLRAGLEAIAAAS